MEFLIILSNPDAASIASGLGAAATRKGIVWSIFLTNDGVKALWDMKLVETINKANQSVACHESWQAHMGNGPCPIESGSQTNNSSLVASAKKVISL